MGDRTGKLSIAERHELPSRLPRIACRPQAGARGVECLGCAAPTL